EVAARFVRAPLLLGSSLPGPCPPLMPASRFSDRRRDRFSGDAARGPGGLKIEPAGDAIDVQNFTGKVHTFRDSALHRLQLNVAQVDTAAGDELVLVHAFALDAKSARADLLRQFSRCVA